LLFVWRDRAGLGVVMVGVLSFGHSWSSFGLRLALAG